MELKMSELNQVYNSFSKLTNQRFPVKTSYKLAKLISSLEIERALFQNQFQLLIEHYAEKDETGAPKQTEDKESIIIKKDCLELFEQEYKELLDLPITVPDITFSLEEFGAYDFTPIEIYAIQKFIVE